MIGRNVTKCCNIIHIGQNVLQLPCGSNYNPDTISLHDHDMHCYIPYSSFSSGLKNNSISEDKAIFCATAQLDCPTDTLSWPKTRQLVDKVHKHVCGHSSFSDIKFLLQRNGIWNDSIQDHLSSVIEKCTSCKATALPKLERKVSLSSMNRSFNEFVCIDHMFLEDNCVFHIMDSYSRYSVGSVVPSTTMGDAIPIFDAHWISAFWAPDTVLYDRAFNTNVFKSYLSDLWCEMKPIPPRRHNKNVLESKHRIIRDVYLRLKDGQKDQHTPNESLFVQQALRISNNLYGNEVMSAHELAKGYTYPIVIGTSPVPVPDEIVSAQDQLTAKRKLMRIMRSKAVKDEPVAPVDLVEIFIKHDKEKRGSWTSPRPVLSYVPESHTVVVSGKNGRKRTAALEDTRKAVLQDELAIKVQEAIDELNVSLDVALCEATDDEHEPVEPQPQPQHDVIEDTDIMSLPRVGDGIELFWPADNQFSWHCCIIQ